MKIYSREQVERLRERYPQGAKVCLDCMEGEERMPSGLAGTVAFVDDAGQIHVKWENGSGLALVPGVDQFHKLSGPKRAEKTGKGEPSR